LSIPGLRWKILKYLKESGKSLKKDGNGLRES